MCCKCHYAILGCSLHGGEQGRVLECFIYSKKDLHRESAAAARARIGKPAVFDYLYLRTSKQGAKCIGAMLG